MTKTLNWGGDVGPFVFVFPFSNQFAVPTEGLEIRERVRTTFQFYSVGFTLSHHTSISFMELKTTRRDEGSGKVAGLKLKRRTRTLPPTPSPKVSTDCHFIFTNAQCLITPVTNNVATPLIAICMPYNASGFCKNNVVLLQLDYAKTVVKKQHNYLITL